MPNYNETQLVEVANLICESKIDIFAISGTKLDSSYSDSLYQLNGYTMYRQDKRSNSGGLMTYINNTIPATSGPVNICNENFECQSLELNYNGNVILVMPCYKNPKMPTSEFKVCFNEICEEVFDKYEHVVIIGDLNFNMLHTNALSDMCPVFNLTNIISEPTCHKSEQSSLIDVMLVSKRRKFIKGFSYNVGISDFHNIIGGILRLHRPPPPSKTIFFRNFAKVNYNAVKDDLANSDLTSQVKLSTSAEGAFDILHSTLIDCINKHAPRKSKVIKSSDFPFMSSRLRKSILIRNQLRNKYFKYRTIQHLAMYRKHRNLVTLIKREEIKSAFEQKCKGGTRNKDFWKAVKPIFSKTKTKVDTIPLKENNNIITETAEVCNIFNKFFKNIGADIGETEDNSVDCNLIIRKYENHPSVLAIRELSNQHETQSPFKFKPVSIAEIKRIIKDLSSKKASGYDDIPISFVKNLSNSLVASLTIVINKCIEENHFPNDLKRANITPLYKKKDKLNKDNYRSVHLLSCLSKILEKTMNIQMYKYLENLFHPYLSGFRKGYGCQDILLRMVEDWKHALDNKLNVGIVAIDLSKAFDCISHGLILAKLHAYGFDINACKFLQSYLVDRSQRVKIGDITSEWTANIKGVPQGSILGPLLFNIFINDFLFSKRNAHIYNYADDNTLSIAGNDLAEIKCKLESDCQDSIEWFKSNLMKANADKFQLLLLGKSADDFELTIMNTEIKPSPSIKVLGIEIDNKLTFEVQIDNICAQTSKQINALKRNKLMFNMECRLIVFNSYIASNFNYCPVVWTFTGRTIINKLEQLHKRAVRFTVNDSSTSYEEICKKQDFLPIYLHCIKGVAVQMYKVKKCLAPSYINDLFQVRDSTYNMRNSDAFVIPKYNLVKYGKKSLRFYGPKLWNKLPSTIKESPSLFAFKKNVTKWLMELDSFDHLAFN